MEKRNDYYVYIYYDPRKTPVEPIYVGKGIDKRMYCHLRPTCKNNILKGKIKHMRENGLEPIVKKLKENLTNEESIKIEKELILKFGRINNNTGILCNYTDGGFGTDGYKHKPETIELYSQMRRGKYPSGLQKANSNRVVSEETKLKQSLANKGHNRQSRYQMNIIKNNEYGAKTYGVTFPDGRYQIIKNMAKFCRENNLDRYKSIDTIKFKIEYKGYIFNRI